MFSCCPLELERKRPFMEEETTITKREMRSWTVNYTLRQEDHGIFYYVKPIGNDELLKMIQTAYPRLEDVGVLRKVFKTIFDTEEYTFCGISNELSLMGSPVNDGVLSKFYNNKTNLNKDN
ncbi:uncharacterized protein OCT59_024754 [Rhizophagus irregularis]|uniref:uncharacterized protein n=1 Tax=Rhizophagus irregularis TaxID=588596 RepID=UPI003321087D|nr:hypothetical protein OCT59_024754 [Rhizophagus irregularis]